MNIERKNGPWVRLAWGIIFVAAGLVLWLDQQGRADARELFAWWPLALVVIGLAHLPERRWVSAFAWTAIGLLFLPQLGFSHSALKTVLSIWPLMITFAGLSLVSQALRPRGTGRILTATAVMAGNNILTGAEDLAGIDAVAVMGGCVIDLREAGVPSQEITINVLAFWGGIDIVVPDGWQVIDRVSPILGGLSDKTAPARQNAPRVIVRGTAIMGGVEVKNSGNVRR